MLQVKPRLSCNAPRRCNCCFLATATLLQHCQTGQRLLPGLQRSCSAPLTLRMLLSGNCNATERSQKLQLLHSGHSNAPAKPWMLQRPDAVTAPSEATERSSNSHGPATVLSPKPLLKLTKNYRRWGPRPNTSQTRVQHCPDTF